ncbi:GD14551, partial [Drosophila simulans]
LRSPVSKRRQSRLTTINLHSLLEAPKSVKVSLRARVSGESRMLSRIRDSDSKPASPHVTQYQG